MKPLFFSLNDSSGLRAHVYSQFNMPVSAQLAGQHPVISGPAKFRVRGKARSWPAMFKSPDGVLIVSEKTAMQLEDDGVGGYAVFDAELEFTDSFALLATPIPRYFWLKPLGSLEIDEHRIMELSQPGGGFERTYPVRETWNGGDFIRIAKRNWNLIYCSRRIVELARKHHWKSLMFIPMDLELGVYTDYVDGRYWIDYLGRKWPPDWYPPGMQGDPSNLEDVAES